MQTDPLPKLAERLIAARAMRSPLTPQYKTIDPECVADADGPARGVYGRFLGWAAATARPGSLMPPKHHPAGKLAVTSLRPAPRHPVRRRPERTKKMLTERDLYLAAYDVAAPRRLRAALDLVRGYATGGQYSVHECWLTVAERAQLIVDAESILDPNEDRMLLMRLNPRGAVITLGVAEKPTDPSCFYIA